jgi:hypothetical protein
VTKEREKGSYTFTDIIRKKIVYDQLLSLALFFMSHINSRQMFEHMENHAFITVNSDLLDQLNNCIDA